MRVPLNHTGQDDKGVPAPRAGARQRQDGSIIVVAMLVLVMISVMGISSINTSSIETQLAGNEREFVKEFYVADAAWKMALQWLNNRSTLPLPKNTTGNVIRNYGNGGEDVLNSTFPSGSEDGTIEGLPYWYRIEAIDFQGVAQQGSGGGGFRRFQFKVSSISNREHEIEILTNKVFQVGF